MKELEEIKKIFLSDEIDEEDRLDNEAKIKEWETALLKSDALSSWASSDVTKDLVVLVKKAYRDHALRLIERRDLTEQERMSLWAKQDACLFLLSLIQKDPKRDIEQLKKEIELALEKSW